MNYGICQWNLPIEGYAGCYELPKLGLDGMELNYTEELIQNLSQYQTASAETGILFPTLGMCLCSACKMAEAYGILIGTENALGKHQNLILAQLVDHPLFRFYFDNQNLWRMKGQSCQEVLSVMKEHLIEVHVKDSLILDDNQTWMPLGQGDCEFASSMKSLKEFGFQGWIHLENDYQIDPTNDTSYSYTDAIQKDLNTLKAIFA